GGHLGRQWLLPMLSAVVDVARQENNPTSIGLTQYLDPPYWTWAAKDAKGAAVLQQGAGPIVAFVVQRLEAVGCEVIEAYGIVHDKDHREVWSAVEQQLVPELKPDHVHAVIKFASRGACQMVCVSRTERNGTIMTMTNEKQQHDDGPSGQDLVEQLKA